jgi:uncharacterized protein (TIGR03118 family)
MISTFMPMRRVALSAALALAYAFAGSAHAGGQPPNTYAVHNLVSNGSVPADHVDANLLNPWGIAFNPAGFSWVADNHSGKSTLYDGLGNPQSLVVTVPPADPASGGTGSPTGIVYSGTSDFVVSNGTASGPSRFIFVSEDGAITGWAPNVDLNNAILVSASPKAIYKGLAIANASTGVRLYATDFHHGRVDMFDGAFGAVSIPGSFVDPRMPHHMAPFGIQALGDRIYVTYATQDADREDDLPGRGIVDVFDLDGKFIKRGAAQAGLNAPWGVAMAPADFGRFSNALLVANFGDGTISAFDSHSLYLGRLRDANDKQIRIPGLWGIQFGNGLFSQPTNTLFFAAGPNDENDGVYGSISVATPAK